MVSHVSSSTVAPLDALPGWATLVRAANPGPMTLDGTNTWVLRAPGAAECVVVDPGPLDEEHLAAAASHGDVAGVVLTHGHLDHSEGVPRFLEITGAPLISGGSPFVEAAGDVEAAGERAGLCLTILPTPGHTADSVCLLVSYPDGAEPAVLTGDTILGRGTTIVAWPDGDLGDYLASLRQLTEVGAGPAVPALPGHGPALSDCAGAAAYYLAHREARLDEVRAALAAGDRTPQEIVARVYADVAPNLWPAAEWSVRAQLAYLERESPGRPPRLDEP